MQTRCTPLRKDRDDGNRIGEDAKRDLDCRTARPVRRKRAGSLTRKSAWLLPGEGDWGGADNKSSTGRGGGEGDLKRLPAPSIAGKNTS